MASTVAVLLVLEHRWVIEETATGSRFTFNDHIEFPYGPLGKVTGWFGTRNAKTTGGEGLDTLKRLVEESVRQSEEGAAR